MIGILLALALLGSCRLNEEKGPDTFSFTKHFDSLARLFDGDRNKTEGIRPVILPGSKLRLARRELEMPVKTFASLPSVSVEPENLVDKSLLWSSSHPDVAALEKDRLRALMPGTALIHVALESDNAKKDALWIIVVPNPKLPESLKIIPETPTVAARGRPGQFQVQVFPAAAGKEVTWQSLDSNVAIVAPHGEVTALYKGETKVKAISLEAWPLR